MNREVIGALILFGPPGWNSAPRVCQPRLTCTIGLLPRTGSRGRFRNHMQEMPTSAREIMGEGRVLN
jgi:hypothetical protein